MASDIPPPLLELIPRRRRGPRYNKRVKLPYLRKQAMTVLARDIEKLMDISFERSLNKDQSFALVNYLKLIKELQKIDESKGDDNPTEID